MPGRSSPTRIVRGRLPFRLSPYWLLFFLLVWWVLAEPRPGMWIGAVLAAAVGGSLHRLLGGREFPRVRTSGLIAFLPYFVEQSFRGGLDVSRRALAPSMPLEPELLHFPMSLPGGPARIFFMSILSLLPGTLSAQVRGDELLVHLLTRGREPERKVLELERRVAMLFGIDLREADTLGPGADSEEGFL